MKPGARASIRMVRSDRWKRNDYPEGHAELYDVKNDPPGQRNLAVASARKPI